MQRSDVKLVYDIGMKAEEFAISETSRFWAKEQLYKWIDSKDDVLLVAEENREIIGYVTSQLHTPTGKATIENVYVDEQYRRRGTGSDLIQECLKQLEERGATYVCGMVKLKDRLTTEFLKSLGFNKGYDFVWMEIYL